MPLFNLACKSCGTRKRKIADSAQAAAFALGNCDCGADVETWTRYRVGVSTQVMERLDNGAMPRAVERVANAEELHFNRARAADPLSGGAQKIDRSEK